MSFAVFNTFQVCIFFNLLTEFLRNEYSLPNSFFVIESFLFLLSPVPCRVHNLAWSALSSSGNFHALLGHCLSYVNLA